MYSRIIIRYNTALLSNIAHFAITGTRGIYINMFVRILCTYLISSLKIEFLRFSWVILKTYLFTIINIENINGCVGITRLILSYR